MEGVEKFKAALELTVRAEFSETETRSESTSQDIGGGESTEVPPGKSVIIVADRKRVDSTQELTAQGGFTHSVIVGQFSHHTKHPWHSFTWDSWADFTDCVTGDAPDNWPLAPVFKEHPPNHKDLWALRDIDIPLRYKVAHAGKIIRNFSVRAA